MRHAHLIWVLVIVALPLLASIARAQPESSRDEATEMLVSEARAALARAAYATAADRLDRALAADPRRIDAYVLRAAVYAATKEYAQGVALLRRALKLAPDNADVLTSLAIQTVLSGDLADGIPRLEAVTSRWPERYEAQLMLSRYYATRGRHVDAATALEAYFAHRPATLAREDAVHRIDLGDNYLRGGRVNEAVKVFAELAASGDNLRARLGLAWATAAVDCTRAIPLLDELASRADQYPEVGLVRGHCAAGLGDATRASEEAESYLQRRPGAAEGLALRGIARLAGGDPVGAREALVESLRLAPNPVVEIRLARAERLAGDHGAAAARLEAAGAAQSDDRWLFLELAEAYLDGGRFADASALVEGKIAALPDDVWAHTVLGDALYRSGALAAARPILERAVALAPDRERPRKLLADSLHGLGSDAFRNGRTADAETLLARSVELVPNPESARRLGIVWLEDGKAEQAIEPLALAAAAGDARAKLLHGRALALAGRVDEAVGVLRDVAEAGGELGAEAVVELAATYVTGDAPGGIKAIQRYVDRGADKAVLDAFVTLARATARTEMRAGQYARAARSLEKAEEHARGDALVAVRCELALAATAAGQRAAADARLRALRSAKVSKCPFAAPYDELTLPVLDAMSRTTRPGDTRRALATLAKLRKRTSGGSSALVGEAIRAVALRGAARAYAGGSVREARRLLDIARQAAADRLAPELLYDDAVLELAEGGSSATAALNRLIADVPEALIALGVAAEVRGDPLKALEHYRRAADTAARRFEPLADWIAAKERVFGAQE